MEAMELVLTLNIPNRPPNPSGVIQTMYLDSTCMLCGSLNQLLTPINLLQHEVFVGIDNVLVDHTFELNGMNHHLAQGCFAYKNPQ
jgi:hypothetical protein